MDLEGEIATPLVTDSNGDSGESSSSFNLTLIFSSLVAVSGSYVFGTSLGYSSPAENGIVSDLGLSTSQAFSVSNVCCILGWLGIILAKDVFWLDSGRFIMGFGVGLYSYVVPVYVAEITPKNVRGSLTSLNQLMIGIGKALTFIIGSLVNWRTLAIIGILPCLFQMVGLCFIPESPRWLAKMGRELECDSSLQHLRGKDTDISKEAADIKDYTESLKLVLKDGIFDLFQRKYVYPLTVGVGLMVFQELGGLNGFAFYASTVFDTAGFSSTTGSIVASVVQLIMTTLGVLLIDKSGRRLLLLISAIGCSVGCVLTGLSFLFQDLHLGQEIVSILVLFGVVVYLGFFELGLGGIPWIIMSEIFPVNIKGPAGSIITLVNWAGSWFVAYTFNFLFDWSTAGTFFLYAAISIAGVVFIAITVPETKGRTLEEIQAYATSTS